MGEAAMRDPCDTLDAERAELRAYMAASKVAPRRPPMSEPLRDLETEDPDWQWVQGDVDPGIRRAVELLRRHWFETAESCEGGLGHAYPEPQIIFGPGDESAGPAAWHVLTDAGFPVKSMKLERWYCVGCDEVSEPEWVATFERKDDSDA